jgi:uncharacterized protein YdeI (YjbR/CyaY-like superfamily)
MGKKDPRIDAYIEKAADFAKPVLKHFRQLMHKVCPGVQETWKWSFPHFDYNGGPLAHMASFKQHCAIGFWKASLMKDNEKLMTAAKSESAMGHFGKITSISDLPKDGVIIKYIHEGMKLNELGVKRAARKSPSAEVEVLEYFTKAIGKNKKANETFRNFSNSQKKEYVMWVTGAKSENTRLKRLLTAIEWMEEGKIRNWKYIK